MAKKTTLLIVDDHPLVREGLKSVINTHPNYEVIGEAENGSKALRMVTNMKPDVVLMDVSLPDQSGIEITRQIQGIRRKTRVIIVSMHSKTDFIVKAFQAGARGYIVKESAPEKLLQAIQNVLDGEYYMDSTVSGKVVEKLLQHPSTPRHISNDNYDALTAREQELLGLMAEGLSNDQIADMLFISVKTVKNHRASIMKKLNIHSTHELIRYAARLGLIDLDLWKE
jgi:DNA-binding NarL/FixJ family response regulator